MTESMISRDSVLRQSQGCNRLTLRFWVPGFGFRVSGFGCRVSNSGFRVPGFGFWGRVSGVGCRVLGFGFRGLPYRWRNRRSSRTASTSSRTPPASLLASGSNRSADWRQSDCPHPTQRTSTRLLSHPEFRCFMLQSSHFTRRLDWLF